MSEAVELLRKVSLFHDAGTEELTRLATMLTSKNFAKDAPIVAQSEPGDAMYIIKSGRVKVVLYGDSGREVILDMLKPGEVFGEMALLDNQPRSAHVIAVESSTLLVLKREHFHEHLKAHVSTALNVIAELSRRLRRADEIIGNLSTLDVYGRVAHAIIEMAKKDGEEQEGGILIKSRPTQQDIASMIGTSRETVSRVLSEFQKRGYVEMQGRNILLSRRFAAGVEDTAIAT